MNHIRKFNERINVLSSIDVVNKYIDVDFINDSLQECFDDGWVVLESNSEKPSLKYTTMPNQIDQIQIDKRVVLKHWFRFSLKKVKSDGKSINLESEISELEMVLEAKNRISDSSFSLLILLIN